MPLTQQTTETVETRPSAPAAELRTRRTRSDGPRRDAVLEVLRQEITMGRYDDGERLVEDRIARELDTSRGPVREALRQLEHEGLVVSYPYRGAVVLGVSEEEVQQVLKTLLTVLLDDGFYPSACHVSTTSDSAELSVTATKNF